jgi:hypothetical protein
MNLHNLNEAVAKIAPISVYFDKKSKTIKIADTKTPKKDIQKVATKDDFIKFGKQMNAKVSESDWVKISTSPKKVDAPKGGDPKFIKALEAMEEDILKKTNNKAYKGI